MKSLAVESLAPNPDLVYETVVSKFDTDFGKVCVFGNRFRST